MKRAWSRIHAHLAAHPDRLASLRDPVDEAAVAEAERTLGVELPADYVASLRIHDGQNDEALYDGWRLLALAEVVESAGSLRHLLEAGEFEGYRTEHDAKIAGGWYDPGWIPIMGDGFGDLVCLDLAPGKRGKPGQVIFFCHDDAERSVLASSFKAWMQKIARELPKRAAEPPATTPVEVEHDGTGGLFRNSKAAQKRAVRGDTGLALAALERFHDQGDASATASVVYLRAYLGDWDRVLPLAERVMRAEGAFHHMNVPFDVARLATQAAARTDDWQALAAIAEVTPDVWGNARRWLAESASEHADVFSRHLDARRSQRTEQECVEGWARYEADGVPSTYDQDEPRRRRHRLLMAVQYERRDVARALMRDHPEACEFRDAVEIAHWFEPDEAWAAIISRLSTWMPVYYAEVAPADLLTRSAVADLMTPERCRQVLDTPRARWWWDYGRG